MVLQTGKSTTQVIGKEAVALHCYSSLTTKIRACSCFLVGKNLRTTTLVMHTIAHVRSITLAPLVPLLLLVQLTGTREGARVAAPRSAASAEWGSTL